MRVLAIILLLAALALPAETVLYEAAWIAGDTPAGWTLEAAAAEFGVHDGAPFLRVTEGRARLRLEAGAGRVIRIRTRAAFTANLVAAALPFHAGRAGRHIPLSGQMTFFQPRPEPRAVEFGFVMPEGADAFEFMITCRNGTATLSDLRILDLGPAPAPEIDPAEILADPGWENVPERIAIPEENPYHRTLNGWQGWLRANVDVHAVTPTPSRVRTGRRAVVIAASGGGIRQGGRQPNVPPVKLGRCYNFSVWAKGHGVFNIHAVGLQGSPTYAVSPDEWRQFHFPITNDNPAVPSFGIGLLVRGRIFFDDFSLREIPRDEVEDRRIAADSYLASRWPARLVQEAPPGEDRPATPVVLENDRRRVVLSPVGGGRVIEFADRGGDFAWRDLEVMAFGFEDQPVPIDWRVPFRVEHHEDGHGVTFSHTVTGGEAAPFLDGIRIEQTFTLPPDEAVLHARLRLTNTAAGIRLPRPRVVNHCPGEPPPLFSAYGSTLPAGYVLQPTIGQAGLFATDDERIRLPQPIAGWAAASRDGASLIFGFAPRAVDDQILDPRRRELSWTYPRLNLPPGASWETETFLAHVPLDRVAYADADLAAKVALSPEKDGNLLLDFAAAPLRPDARARARIIDYGGDPAFAVGPAAARRVFFPPDGLLITVLDLTVGGETRSVELFNDLPGRITGFGIHGAGQNQYSPAVPARVLDLPDPGDLRPALATAAEVLWGHGFYAHAYPFPAILAARGLDVKALPMGGGFPEDLEELLTCRLVVLSNLGARHLSANARAVLSQYVRGGGTLLVTGGSDALGNAATTGTDLEALLPAELAGPFDCRPLPADDRELRPGEALAGLPWDARPQLYWAHRLTPRPDAAVLARAGGRPVLLQHRVGRGRVMLFGGTVEGDPQPGETAVWDWPGWPDFWRRALDLLLAD